MQTPQPTQEMIVVEFNGTKKRILKDRLQEARQMEAQMQSAARKTGVSEQEIKEMFTLRIMEE